MNRLSLGSFRCRLGSSFRFLCASLMGLAFAAVCPVAPATFAQSARTSAQGPLQIYFVDVEGGQSTLFITPAHQSLLIDTGWNDHNGRDADRIVALAKQAGIKKMDYVLITHFHEDHVGGVPNLLARMPVGTFIDHGVNYETTDAATVKVWNAYRPIIASGKYKHIIPKPGDVLPIRGIHAQVISSNGALLSKPLPGAGQPNEAACKISEHRPPDQTENGHSLGTLITFGKLRFLDLGDLTWDKEMLLTCPVNKIGKVDVYIVSHHGWYKSSSPALLHGISPRVAIMDNGSDKGGTPSAWDIIDKTPGLENLWQLHYSEEGGATHNVPTEFIANPHGPDGGHYFKLTAWPNGTFEVFNSRTQKTKRYPAR